MKCPNCASLETHVLETRTKGVSTRRRHACVCGERFTTLEFYDGIVSYLSRSINRVLEQMERGVALRARTHRLHKQIAAAVADGESPTDAARRLKVHRNTVYRALRRHNTPLPEKPAPVQSTLGLDLANAWFGRGRA